MRVLEILSRCLLYNMKYCDGCRYGHVDGFDWVCAVWIGGGLGGERGERVLHSMTSEVEGEIMDRNRNRWGRMVGM